MKSSCCGPTYVDLSAQGPTHVDRHWCGSWWWPAYSDESAALACKRWAVVYFDESAALACKMCALTRSDGTVALVEQLHSSRLVHGIAWAAFRLVVNELWNSIECFSVTLSMRGKCIDDMMLWFERNLDSIFMGVHGWITWSRVGYSGVFFCIYTAVVMNI